MQPLDTYRLVEQTLWAEDSEVRLDVRIVGTRGQFVERIRDTYPQLGKVARASLGCQAYNSSKHTAEQIKARIFHSDKKLSDEYLPELAGNDVSRYFIERKRGQWIKYGPWLHDYRSLDWLQGPRLLVREIPDTPPYQIQASYVEDVYCNYKTILNVNPSEHTTFSMKYLLGILNSRLLSYLYPLMSNKIVAATFPRISVGDIRKLPIRPINFDDPADVKRHDRVVAMVEKMLDLHQRHAQAEAGKEDRRHDLARQIERLDRDIDHLVYTLYDLTPDEIAIIEGRAAPSPT